MLNLDTLGRLEGGELLVLGTGSAREWPHLFRGAGYVTGLPLKIVSDDYGGSDQKSFLDAGVPSVHLFSGPHGDYHRASDSADKLDLEGMVRTAALLKEVVEYLAARAEPLTVALGDTAVQASASAPGSRRVTLGTVPDFAYEGPGVRLSGVTPDSPAEQAGLQSGDVIVGIDDRPVAALRTLAEALRAMSPNQQIRVRFRRAEHEQEVTTSVVAR